MTLGNKVYRGEKGDKGDTEPKGEQGDTVEKGDTGPQGTKGEKGDNGETPVITVVEDTPLTSYDYEVHSSHPTINFLKTIPNTRLFHEHHFSNRYNWP